MKKLTLISIIVILVFPQLFFNCKRKSNDRLLYEGKIKAVEKRCKKKNKSERKKCFNKIALFLLNNQKYKEAAHYYATADEPIKALNSYFRGDLNDEAEQFFLTLKDQDKRNCANVMGKKFYLTGDYNKSIHYYKISNNNEQIKTIQSKIPLFKLLDKIKTKSGEKINSELKKLLNDIKNSISTYIYMDPYMEWNFEKKSEPYKTAAQHYYKALSLIDEKLLPNLIQYLETDIFNDIYKNQNSLSFCHFKFHSLTNLIKNLNHITKNKEFFLKYSKVYQESKSKKEKPIHPLYNYEQVYNKTMIYTKTLLEEIEESTPLKNTKMIPDYINDISIDNKVINYIESILNNTTLRISEIQKKSRKLKKNIPNKKVEKQADIIFWDFVHECNQMLFFISKEEYQKANNILVSGYQFAKEKIDNLSNINK